VGSTESVRSRRCSRRRNAESIPARSAATTSFSLSPTYSASVVLEFFERSLDVVGVGLAPCALDRRVPAVVRLEVLVEFVVFDDELDGLVLVVGDNCERVVQFEERLDVAVEGLRP